MSGPDILREVEESMRVEKAMRFWNTHGKTIIVLLAFIIVGTAAQALWTSYKQNQEQKSTSEFLDALKNSDPISALTKLNQDGNGSGSALAGLNAAAMSIEKKDWKAAIQSYLQVIQNKSAPQSYKDLAIIQMVSLQMDHDVKLTGDDLLKAIAPVIENQKSPWHPRALFLSALIKSSKNKDLEAARADLQKLSGLPHLPQSFLVQVKALDEVYKIKMGAKK